MSCHHNTKNGAAWQLIEERIDDGYVEETFTLDRIGEFYWGARYIDDLIMRRLADDDETPTWARWQPA